MFVVFFSDKTNYNKIYNNIEIFQNKMNGET